MELYSLRFFTFLMLSLLAYYLAGFIRPKAQWCVLLCASLISYLIVNAHSMIFILSTALTVWAGAMWLSSLSRRRDLAEKSAVDRAGRKAVRERYAGKRRLVFLLVLAVNLGILCYIKYWNVILGHLRIHHGLSSLLLPLGISFYTFQSLGYLIDIYYDKYECERNPFRFLLFVSYFPQLIQGPINRFNNIQKDLFSAHKPDTEMFRLAILYMGYGYLKKCAIADMMSPMIAGIFDKPDPNVPGAAVLFGILSYSVQQYCDFSGGIDIVLGVSMLFGIRMTPNFRQPYFSVSLADFWRRWHITLGTWMRDYVFYPFAVTRPMQNLGKYAKKHFGRHAGRTLPACIANLLVFFLVGLWHGAETHYLLWGIYNGLVIAASDLFKPAFQKLNGLLHIREESRGMYIFRIIRTFVIVNIGWFFDRITDFSYCRTCFLNVFRHFDLAGAKDFIYAVGNDGWVFAYRLAAACLVFVFIISVLKERKIKVEEGILHLALPLRWLLYVCVIAAVLWSFTVVGIARGFMYANF